MPIYEYECLNCSRVSEEFQHIHDDPLLLCTGCGQETLVRRVSLPHTDMREYQTPIVMYSVAATSEEELLDLKLKCPSVDISTDPNEELYGVPVVRTRKEKLAVLRAVGFEEKN